MTVVIVAAVCWLIGYCLGRAERGDRVLALKARLHDEAHGHRTAESVALAARAEAETAKIRATAAVDNAQAAQDAYQQVVTDLQGLADRLDRGVLPVVAARAVRDVLARHQGAAR